MEVRKSRFKLLNVLAVIFGVTLAITNFLLLQENYELRDSLQARAIGRRLEPGNMVPVIRGVGINGKLAEYGFETESRKTILFVMSPACPVCDKNWPNWQEIINQAPKNTYRMIFANLHLNLPTDYILEHKLGELDTLEHIDPQSMIDYRLQFTPQTILISPHGEVQNVWTGDLRFPANRILEIHNILNVNIASQTK